MRPVCFDITEKSQQLESEEDSHSKTLLVMQEREALFQEASRHAGMTSETFDRTKSRFKLVSPMTSSPMPLFYSENVDFEVLPQPETAHACPMPPVRSTPLRRAAVASRLGHPHPGSSRPPSPDELDTGHTRQGVSG